MSCTGRKGSICAAAGVAALTLFQGAWAQTPAPASTADLKRLSLEELMSLEVTSVSKRPQKLSETASAIQVITGDDIRRSGATSVPEALRLASNLEVARIDSRQWAVTARGFNNTLANKMLVLIDGRTVYTPLYAGVYWDVQDTLLQDIDRIEVISGPGATLWGANAVNGVINIITKSSKDTQGGFVTADAGTQLNSLGGLRYGGELSSGMTYRVYGKYFDRDGSVLPDGQDVADSWHVAQGGFRLDWDKNNHDALTLQGDLYGGASERTSTSADVDMSGGNVLGRWSRALAEGSGLQLQMYYDRTHRSIRNSIAQDLDTYDLDFQHRFPLASSHDIVWGLSYRLVGDDITSPATIVFLPARVTHDWFGGFAQDEITLVPGRLHLTIGTKLEHNDYTGFEFQPSIRAAWQPGGDQTVWSAISRAVRTPSRIDRDLFIFRPTAPPTPLLLGGPDFVSEKLLSYELGYRVQPDRRLALSLATFYNDYDDLRSIEPLNPPAPSPFVLANGLQGKSYGAEFSADYRLTDIWRLQLGYTELRASSEPKPGSLDRTSTRSVALDPKHQAVLRSSLDLPAGVQCDTTLRYVSRIDNQDVPAYTELDLRLGWRPRSAWELSLVGQNLLHDQHPEFGAAASLREIERSVYGKISWSF